MSSLKVDVWDRIKLEEREDKLEAQQEYCERHQLPIFVDVTAQECWNCGKYVLDGYNLEDCAKSHLTSCPFCNTSFTD